MGLRGRFYSNRDLRLINSFNNELVDTIIQSTVVFFKLFPQQNKINMYGESDNSAGKSFFNGIEIACQIQREDITSEDADFGVDRKQDIVFKFREELLKELNLFPEIGDILQYNGRYYECNNSIREQLLGDIPEKSFSVIVNAHYTRLSKINVVSRQT